MKRKTKMNLRQKIVLEDSKAFIPNKSKISRIFSIINKMYIICQMLFEVKRTLTPKNMIIKAKGTTKYFFMAYLQTYFL